MKSKFAKFTDGTLGAFLIFFAAFAVFRYYTTADLAAVCAFTTAACALLLQRFAYKSSEHKTKLSAAADEMFFDFMFKPDDAPAKLLHSGLTGKGLPAVRHGKGVYVNGAAAYCVFGDNAAATASVARLISAAKHYGAHKLILLCKTPPSVPSVDGMTVTAVCGEDVYKLFGSLGKLPPHEYKKSKKTSSALAGALSSDKTVRYALLSVAFFFVFRLNDSIITVCCAAVCAALAVACVIKRLIARLRN